MDYAKFKPLTDKLLKVQYLIWGSNLMFTVVLAVVAYILTSQNPPREYPNPTIPYALAALAVIAFAVPFLEKLYLSDGWLKKCLTEKPDPEKLARDPNGRGMDRDLLEELKKLSVPEQQTYRAVKDAVTRYIMFRWGATETIALYGFILTVLSSRFETYLPFGAVAFVRLLTLRPGFGSLLERVEGFRRSG